MTIMHDTDAPGEDERYEGKLIRHMSDAELAAALAQYKAMALDLPGEALPEAEAAVEILPVQKMARVTRQQPGRDIETIQRAWLKLVWPVEKVQITLWMDADIVAMFKGSGKGYQKRINTVLRAFTDWHRAHPAARAG